MFSLDVLALCDEGLHGGRGCDGPDGTHDAGGGLVDELEGVLGEDGGFVAGGAHSAFDVGEGLLLGQSVDADGDGNRVGQGLEGRETEPAVERLGAAEDDGQGVQRIILHICNFAAGRLPIPVRADLDLGLQNAWPKRGS